MGGSTTVNFNDTSEYMYRNSSIKKGGFRGNVGFTRTDTSLDVDGTEDVTRTQDQLLAADRDLLRQNIAVIHDCALNRMCSNATTLEGRADYAWDRAINLYPTLRTLLDDEITALKFETMQRIRLAEYAWRRIAGSSLNCAVAHLDSSAENELSVRVAGVVAEALQKYKMHETEAIARAFADNLNARLEPSKVMFAHVGTLWQILRGAQVTDVTDRDYTEARDEDTTVFDARGEFYHEATAIADNSGTYAGDADQAYADSVAIAGGIS